MLGVVSILIGVVLRRRFFNFLFQQLLEMFVVGLISQSIPVCSTTGMFWGITPTHEKIWKILILKSVDAYFLAISVAVGIKSWRGLAPHC